MLKTLFTLLLLTGYMAGKSQAPVHHHNKIDDTNSAKEIKKIIDSALGDDNEFYFVDKKRAFKDTVYKRLMTDIKPLPWVKADFDNNGWTDLLVIEKSKEKPDFEDNRLIVCIMDSGENHFFIKKITRSKFPLPMYPVVAKVDSTPAVLCYSYYRKLPFPGYPGILTIDTLVFKFGDFVEYNHAPKQYDIENIKCEFQPSYMFWKAPSTFISINKDRSVAIYIGDDSSGKKEALIDDNNYQQITGLLNYIDFASLKDEYRVDWTDDATCYLTVTYNNGKTKKIMDYGLIGSFGLNNLYSILRNLRLTQNWK